MSKLRSENGCSLLTVAKDALQGVVGLVSGGLAASGIEEAGSAGLSALGSGAGTAAGDVLTADEAAGVLEEAGLNPAYADSFEGQITERTVQPGETFYRYSSYPTGEGNFLTTTEFSSPPEAVKGLDLGPYKNDGTYRQLVTAISPSTVLEGEVFDGGQGVTQTLILDTNAFSFSTGVQY